MPTFNCTGKVDGYYVQQPCTSSFFTCASGNSIKLSCPPTLVFDSVALICEYPNVCETQHTITSETDVLQQDQQLHQQQQQVSYF